MLPVKQSEINELLEHLYMNDKAFCKTMFPEAFFGPFTKLHDPIFELMGGDEKFVAIAAPRGIGKTTICRTKAAKNILYRDSYFIPYVSKSHDAALLQTENLKRDLTSSNIIKKIFGRVKTKGTTIEFQESFSKKSWVAYDSLVMPRGYTQQIRGLVYNNKRPDLFIIDDLEDDEQIENPEYRKKLKVWFNSVLIKAISQFSSNWRILYIDTLKHEDSLLQDLLDSSKWASVRLSLCNEKIESNVPEIISTEALRKDYAYHEEQGILDVFYREFMNLPIAGKDAIFQKSYFKYYDSLELGKKKNLHKMVIVDPAKTVKLHSAESAIVGVGVDLEANAIYQIDVDAGKFYPDELYDRMFEMVANLGAQVLAVEDTSLNEFIRQPIKNEVVRRGINVELIWLKARGGTNKEKGKDLRIASLAPYYRRGDIWHNPNTCQGLEIQLLSHPRSKRKDIMDAFAYTIELLDLGNLFFEPVEVDGEDESLYDDLEYDEPLDGWRTV